MSRRLARKGVWVVVLLLALCTALALAVRAGEIRGASVATDLDPPLVPGADVSAALTELPLYFIENRGQLDEQVAYYVQGKDKTLYFTPQGVTFVLHGAPDREGGELSHEFPRVPTARWTVKLEFVAANPHVQPMGVDETGALISYFKGRPEEWVTGLTTYSGVVYRDLWPGIDLQYSGTVNRLKYQFVVRAGADPGRIKLAYRGATDVLLDEAGRLSVSTPLGGFSDDAPYAYQEVGGQLVLVDVSYQLAETLAVFETPRACYGFRLGDHDPTLPLILDPAVLVYCGYIGGSESEEGTAIAVDDEGFAYITGDVRSTAASFPDTVGPDLSYNGSVDAFVAQVTADGSTLIYCGYIGGDGVDRGVDIAVSSSGSAYVTGYTDSQEDTFPVLVGPDLTYNGDPNDAFVAKVSPHGTGLLYCGYIGGNQSEIGEGIAVDDSGSAFVVGHTTSGEASFPAAIGPDVTYNGNRDAFVAKVGADGLGLDYCGYIGGDDQDRGHSIAVDSSGNAYVTGYAESDEGSFPVAIGPDLTYNGPFDAFVAKVEADGTDLCYCGYIGGSESDSAHGIDVDAIGRAYVVGSAGSSEAQGFPVTIGPDLTHKGYNDAFIARVSTTGASLGYCGYVGGAGTETAEDVAVDSYGRASITGHTGSSEDEGFPVTVGPDLTYNGGSQDAFVARVPDDGAGLDYCGYIGGAGNDAGQGIALHGSHHAYVTGGTFSSQLEGFPVLVGPDVNHNGGQDVFVAKIFANQRPELGRVLPPTGGCRALTTAYFTTTWTDADGCHDLKQCYFHIGASPSVAGSVTLMYNAQKGKLWLLNDAGTKWTGGYAPGSPHILENSQARVYASLTKISVTGHTVRIQWAIQFSNAFRGSKKTGLKCRDVHKAKAKGAWKGTWVIL